MRSHITLYGSRIGKSRDILDGLEKTPHSTKMGQVDNELCEKMLPPGPRPSQGHVVEQPNLSQFGGNLFRHSGATNCPFTSSSLDFVEDRSLPETSTSSKALRPTSNVWICLFSFLAWCRLVCPRCVSDLLTVRPSRNFTCSNQGCGFANVLQKHNSQNSRNRDGQLS